MRLSTRTILLAVILAVAMSAQVLCPVCVEKGLKSTVRSGMALRTLLGWDRYYDEDGVYHSDDPNTSTTEWYCSQGHKWTETCQLGSCKQSITEDNESEPAPIWDEAPEGSVLFGDEAVVEWNTISIDIPPPDPNEGREVDLFNEDGKVIVFASVNKGFKIYPNDVGPAIVIHSDCRVAINRNSTLEQILGEFAKLIALHSGGPLCDVERPLGLPRPVAN